MKFTLQSVSNFGRAGVISNLGRLPEFEMETPHILLHTKSGTVPHLTHEVLQWVSDKKLGLNIPLQSVDHLQDQMKVYQKSIAEFIGMTKYLTYCSHIQPIEKKMCEFKKQPGVCLWTRHGRKHYTAKSYMELIKDLKPDMFLLLADNESDLNSTIKKTKKSLNKSEKYFEECMEIYKKSDSLKSSQVLAAIQGGVELSLREKASKLINESSVFGVVIDGLHDCSEAVSEIKLQDIKPYVEASLKHVPDSKLRIIHGCWNPSILLDLVELGVDLFDTSYLISVTEQGGAFIFPNSTGVLGQYLLNSVNNKQSHDVIKSNLSELIESELDEPQAKKIKVEHSKFYVSMMNPNYVTDFNPVLENCACLTCKNHTRAYIHHLLTVKELLGSTLLMIHNLHHYLIFFSTIRQALKNGKFQEIKEQFQNWLDNFSS